MAMVRHSTKQLSLSAIDYACEHGKANTIFEQYKLAINTLEGKMQVAKYDYIIKGVKGEFYPCKPDIFEQTYETVKILSNEKRLH